MISEKLVYASIPWLGRSVINTAIRENNVEILKIAALSAALESGDGIWAEKISYKLINHVDEIVRGNACLSLGHIARVHGSLDRNRAIKTLGEALLDKDEYVRGQAEGALDDLKHYIKRNGRWIGCP